MLRWLYREWPYATLFASGFLILLSPFFYAFGLPLFLVYLQLPVYMVHQFEEHDQDRFRTFANQMLAGGREAFTPAAIFVINSLGVWVLNLISLYLAYYVDLAWGLIGIYMTLVNGVTHVAAGLVFRRYNPGLITTFVLFFPASIWGAMVVTKASGADWKYQAAGLACGILVHAAIMVYAKTRIRRLKA